MARVTCPECDTRNRIPDDHDRDYIRCKDCNKKIYLDDEDDEDDRPRRRRFRDSQPPAEQGTGIGGFWPMLLILPLAVMPCLAYMNHVGMIIGIIAGIVMIIAGFVMAWIAAKKAGVGTVDELPWILQRMPIVHLFYQFKYAVQLPKEAGQWVFLEFVGLGIAIACGIIGSDRAPHNDPFAHNPPFQEVPERPLPFKDRDDGPGPGPFNPPINPPPVNPPPQQAAKVFTGDAIIDQSLTDLESAQWIIAQEGARNRAKMPANQHRAIVAQKLAAQLNRPDPDTLLAVVQALNVWATPEEVPALANFIQERRLGAERKAAFEVLVKLRDDRGIPAVVRFFRDNPFSPDAAMGVRAFGPAAENDVLALLNESKNSTAKREMIKILRDIGTEKSLAVLQPMTTATSPTVRTVAQEAVTSINARIKK
jgi:hypothetical protein